MKNNSKYNLVAENSQSTVVGECVADGCEDYVRVGGNEKDRKVITK